GADRSAAPNKLATEFQLGAQATVLIVARDVWESGVKVLSKEQVRQIYEGEVKNWKQVGGADQAIKFYNFAPRRGVQEQLILWIYGDSRRAPTTTYETVLNGEDAQNTISFNRGSITVAPPRWADGKSVFAVALKDESGTAVEPTVPNIVQNKYPMARPIFAIFSDRPVGPRKRLLDFLLSAEGQAFLPKNDFLTRADLEIK
ncbi:MAG TPA: substrate-binding domain-containing protein, partial [Chthoniobacteraceae bacterium]